MRRIHSEKQRKWNRAGDLDSYEEYKEEEE